MKSHKVNDILELLEIDRKGLLDTINNIKINELKNNLSCEIQSVKVGPYESYYGDIFVSLDETNSSFKHGHAGIGVKGSSCGSQSS